MNRATSTNDLPISQEQVEDRKPEGLKPVLSPTSTPFRIVFLVILCVVVAATFARTYRNHAAPSVDFDWSARGLSDFQCMYEYARIFERGLSPYAVQDTAVFPVSRPSAPFSPVIFILMLPLAYLSLTAAEIVFCIVNLLLLGVIARQVLVYSGQRFDWGWWMAILSLIVISRAGHITLYTGYFTAILVIGTTLALHFGKTRPWLAGVGVLLASAKPTYLIPLLMLLAFRRNVQAALIGLVMSMVVAFAGITWLAWEHGYGHVIDSVISGQEAFHDDPTELPVNTWTRIDIAGMVAKATNSAPGNGVYLLTMVVLIIVPGIAIYHHSQRESNVGATGLTAFIAVLALLVTIYHHSYDCLLFIVPWLAMCLCGSHTLPMVGRWWRWTLALLMLVPTLNYVSTMSFRDKMHLEQTDALWQGITMLNGVCLTASLLILVAHAFYSSRSCTPPNGALDGQLPV